MLGFRRIPLTSIINPVGNNLSTEMTKSLIVCMDKAKLMLEVLNVYSPSCVVAE